MKNFTVKFFPFLLLTLAISCFFSCKKDEDQLPDIKFIETGSYVWEDRVVDQGDVVVAGIIASQATDKDVLKSFNLSVSYDGGPATTIKEVTVSEEEKDKYILTVPLFIRSQPGTEKYTFTIISQAGLTNSVSMTLTAQ